MDKKILRKPLILLISLILTVSVGGTLAFLITKSGAFQTVFVPGSVDCEIAETDAGYTVKNTGTADAYIRVAVVPNWTKNGEIYGLAPMTANDYTVTAPESGWVPVNGFYVYKNPVAPGESTSAFAVIVSAAAPEGCELTVDVLAEAIQSFPADAAKEAWGFPVSEGVGE